MANNPNVRGATKLPRPSDNDLKDTTSLKSYLDSLARAAEQSISNIFVNNNTPWVITGAVTATYQSLSIAANTVNLDKVRDNLTSLIYIMKQNRRVN